MKGKWKKPEEFIQIPLVSHALIGAAVHQLRDLYETGSIADVPRLLRRLKERLAREKTPCVKQSIEQWMNELH